MVNQWIWVCVATYLIVGVFVGRPLSLKTGRKNIQRNNNTHTQSAFQVLCVSSNLPKTPHFETWTSLCQHLMNCFPSHWPVPSLCGAACSPNGVAPSFARAASCWLRPCCGVVSACVVLFQAQCGVVEGIVLSARLYCPGLMYVCLFMLQASLSERWQVHATGPRRSHSGWPLTSSLSLLWARLNLCPSVIDMQCL